MRAHAVILPVLLVALFGCASPSPQPSSGDDAFDTPPTLVKFIEPEYPKYAKENNVTGKVTLRVFVKTDGTVSDVVVIESTDAMFNDAAIDAARQFRFKPARRDGRAVPGVVVVPVEFR